MKENDLERAIDDDEEDSEYDSEAEEEKRHSEEERKKAEKARLLLLDTICVFVAFVIILGASADEHNRTFVPLEQEVNSNIKYTANGYIPCNGVAPTPTDCDFPPYQAKVQRPYPT